jgi:hypothetical protein
MVRTCSGIDGNAVAGACADPEGGRCVLAFDGKDVEHIEPMDCSRVALADGRLPMLRWSQPVESSGWATHSREVGDFAVVLGVMTDGVRRGFSRR